MSNAKCMLCDLFIPAPVFDVVNQTWKNNEYINLYPLNGLNERCSIYVCGSCVIYFKPWIEFEKTEHMTRATVINKDIVEPLDNLLWSEKKALESKKTLSDMRDNGRRKLNI
jgi:hypothetical protein